MKKINIKKLKKKKINNQKKQMKISLFFLITLTTSYILEMETYPSKKTCITELFRGGEPLSLTLTATKTPQARYSLYITIETTKKILLAHKKHDFEQNLTNMAFNNEIDQDLVICIDNFESYEIFVKLEILVKHNLGITDSAPNGFEYNKLNLALNEVKERIDSGYGYFVQNEAFTKRMVETGKGFEVFLGVVSVMSLACFVGAGMLLVFFVRRDVVAKKSW